MMSRSKYHRARIRNFLFTVGPNRMSRGRLGKRHLAGGVVRRDLTIASPQWPGEFDGVRIAHVSDFHLGRLITLDHAMEAIELVRDAEADLVACTGDVIDLHHNGEMNELLQAMANIGAPMGTVMVAGNHDELVCGDTFRQAVIDAGLSMLDNDVLTINRNGTALRVGGIGWARTAEGCARLLHRTCPDGVDLLLAHNPKAFLAAAKQAIPLTLSGHTHGGQVAMKGRPNMNLAVGHRHGAGVFERGGSRLHVTTGVGSWFPLRVNCPAEVVVITMMCGDNGVSDSAFEAKP